MQVGRALRSEHACARPAYPCDPLGLRSTRRKRLGHLAVSPCVHRSMLLLLVEQSSSSTRHRCLHRSRAPALWSQYTILGGSDAFSPRCARWCAEHFTVLSHFGARTLFVCVCLCRAAAIRWLLVARPMHVLASPMEPAHGLWRFGCVRAELRAMVCGMCGGSLALLNAAVRGARLLLAVVHGTQKCVGQIRAELWSSEDP